MTLEELLKVLSGIRAAVLLWCLKMTICAVNKVEQKWRKSLGPLILFHRSLDETTNWDREMSQTIKDLYFGDQEISKNTMKQFIKLSGDHMFFGGTEVVVRELVKHGQEKVPTYRYMYSHR